MPTDLLHLLRETHARVLDLGLGEYGYVDPDCRALADRLDRAVSHLQSRPRIVCLCGSTRFYDRFQRANYEETMAGRIVLSVGFYPHSQAQAHGEDVGCTPEQKVRLDELHLRKIDLADEILVLDVGGYVGESTSREIVHAVKTGKPVRWLEPAHGSGILRRVLGSDEPRFMKLHADWIDGTSLMSFPHQMLQHEAGREILDMGWAAVPLLLDAEPEWPVFAALAVIVGWGPAPADVEGGFAKFSFDDVVRGWREWGLRQGFLTDVTATP